MAAGFSSSSNTYIPSFETSGKLVVDFARNVKDFRVNQYCTLVPVKRDIALYLRIDPVAARRLLGSGKNNVWHDGNDAPTGNDNNRKFSWTQVQTTRYAFAAALGYKAKGQADFDIVKTHSAALATQAMTLRTKLVCDKLVDTSNYDSTHTATATASGGGFWTAGTITNPIIKKSLMAGANQIRKDTNGTVRYKNLSLLINPTTADAMARSAEIQDYIAQSPAALDQVRGNKPGQNAEYGLPDQLYGVNVIVEDTVVTTSNEGASSETLGDVFPDNKAVLLARQGSDLVGVEGQVSFSTAHIFEFESMVAETMDDVNNRVHRLRISDDYVAEIVAPATGYVFTAVTS